MKDLNAMAWTVHLVALEKGWWAEGVPNRNFGEVIANIHSEVDEAWKEWVHGHNFNETYYQGTIDTANADVYSAPQGIPTELADIIVRVLDICAAYDIDIQKAFDEKVAYNKTRPYKHGGRRA